MLRRGLVSSATAAAALILGQLGAAATPAAGPGTATEVGDVAVVGFTEATRTVAEALQYPFPPLTVTRNGDTSQQATVHYAHTGGTATPGADFALTPGTLSFAPGETTRPIPLQVYPDTVFDPDETVEITLSSPGEGTILGEVASMTVTIADDDQPRVQFDSVVYDAHEGDGAATITVTRTHDPAVPVSVGYDTSNGSAMAGSDYEATSGTLWFDAGDTSRSFTVPILDDDTVENTEVVELALSDPSGGAALGGPSTARLRIHDNDPAPTLRFSAAAYEAVEGEGTVTVTVHRDGHLGDPVEVDYATSDGSASVGQDYEAASGTLSFDAGDASKSFTVQILDDVDAEKRETVRLALTGPTGRAGLAAPSSATLTIGASDQQPDALVSTSADSGYVGDDVYNRTGAGQTRRLRAHPGWTRTFHVRVQNDGLVRNTIAVRGTGAVVGSRVRYLAGSTDITRAMRSSAGWKVVLRPGGYRRVTVNVSVLADAAPGSRKPATVSATWTGDGTRVDVARVVIVLP